MHATHDSWLPSVISWMAGSYQEADIPNEGAVRP